MSTKRPPTRALSSSGDAGLSMAWFLSQERFTRALALERKRAERSQKCFVLMLLESAALMDGTGDLEKVLRALESSTRETDVKGWYKACSVVGVVFTEIDRPEGRSAVIVLSEKVSSALGQSLGQGQMNEVRLTFHVFPEDWDSERPGGPADPTLYPDLLSGPDRRRRTLLVKRSMDVAGSLAALILAAPMMAVIAVLIKLTSKGPVLFRQTRIGQYGKRFTFFKFRSMYATGDQSLHENHVRELISGQKKEQVAHKLMNDPRITPIGRVLRKTSLDEFPQFFNVLIGDMSLVGPRPPLPYELRAYQVWHRRRLLAVKPGITGIWQVEGRSRVKFEDMVRMDLSYASSWSPWLDLKILLRTPRAVLSGRGAY